MLYSQKSRGSSPYNGDLDELKGVRDLKQQVAGMFFTYNLFTSWAFGAAPDPLDEFIIQYMIVIEMCDIIFTNFFYFSLPLAADPYQLKLGFYFLWKVSLNMFDKAITMAQCTFISDPKNTDWLIPPCKDWHDIFTRIKTYLWGKCTYAPLFFLQKRFP